MREHHDNKSVMLCHFAINLKNIAEFNLTEERVKKYCAVFLTFFGVQQGNVL